MALKDIHYPLFIGEDHIRLSTIPSTNKYAMDMVSKSKPNEGTVISASYQSDGKGQIGRYWTSEAEKNITCSIILYPTFLQAQDQFQLNMAVSLAVHDVVSSFLPDHNIKVKWPNDVYVNNQKIAGILLQAVLTGKKINSVVIGIGLNINQMTFPLDIPNPTSLAIEKSTKLELLEVYERLFECLTCRYRQLIDQNTEEIYSTYLNNLYRYDEWHEYTDHKNHTFEGKIIGVEAHGFLKIEDKDGKINKFAFREVIFKI